MTQTPAMHTVYIGLGANLKDPKQQIRMALSSLATHPQVSQVIASSFYLSKPMGPANQNDYINAVAQLSTSLPPIPLLDYLQKIEQQQGRQRKAERWGPRTLDLDILLYDQQTIDIERLTVPHYGLKQRSFVVLPLLEIAPDLSLPDGTRVAELSQSLKPTGTVRL